MGKKRDMEKKAKGRKEHERRVTGIHVCVEDYHETEVVARHPYTYNNKIS